MTGQIAVLITKGKTANLTHTIISVTTPLLTPMQMIIPGTTPETVTISPLANQDHTPQNVDPVLTNLIMTNLITKELIQQILQELIHSFDQASTVVKRTIQRNQNIAISASLHTTIHLIVRTLPDIIQGLAISARLETIFLAIALTQQTMCRLII